MCVNNNRCMCMCVNVFVCVCVWRTTTAVCMCVCMCVYMCVCACSVKKAREEEEMREGRRRGEPAWLGMGPFALKGSIGRPGVTESRNRALNREAVNREVLTRANRAVNRAVNNQ
jgi:hypothetical protein